MYNVILGYMTNATYEGEGHTGYNGMSQEELMCKVGYAMAANLMVGIYQVKLCPWMLHLMTHTPR